MADCQHCKYAELDYDDFNFGGPVRQWFLVGCRKEVEDPYSCEGYEELDDKEEERNKMNRMDSKKKHPFAVTCRKCGSNRVRIGAYDYRGLEISCKDCGFFLDCGYYDTEENDYSEM